VSSTAQPSPDDSRSARARRAILGATADLLDEAGFATMTIDEVAIRAGSGKATIYRHWPSKGALVMDAIMAEIGGATPFPDTGSVVEDFRVQLRATTPVFNRPRIRRMFIGVIFEAQENPELREAFLVRYLNPRRVYARETIRRGIARGELRPDFDDDILFDQILGAFYMRMLVLGSSLDQPFTDELVVQAFGGVESGARPPPASALASSRNQKALRHG
jgi:AcrR family transcriptional regulator